MMDLWESGLATIWGKHVYAYFGFYKIIIPVF